MRPCPVRGGISRWWVFLSDRRNKVAVVVYNGASHLQMLYVNQRANGGQWNDLPGSYTFSGAAWVVVKFQGGSR
jgi:hypothetical protein